MCRNIQFHDHSRHGNHNHDGSYGVSSNQSGSHGSLSGNHHDHDHDHNQSEGQGCLSLTSASPSDASEHFASSSSLQNLQQQQLSLVNNYNMHSCFQCPRLSNLQIKESIVVFKLKSTFNFSSVQIEATVDHKS